MTVVAIVAAGDVCWMLARRCQAVMTGAASANDLRVIDRDSRRPHIAVVAVFADIGRLYVCQILAGGFHAVMATDAVAGNVHVIEVRRPPGDCGVTIVTGVVAGDVSRVFAGCGNAIMTGAADADDLRVVNSKYGHKNIGAVAVFADVARLNMRRALSGSVHAVMAVDAAARDIDVIKVRRQPRDGRMAIIAVIAAGDMGLVFAGGRDAVMTGAARANDLRVVDRRHGRKHIRAVAVFANVAGLNVHRVLAGGLGAVVATEAVIDNVYVIEDRW